MFSTGHKYISLYNDILTKVTEYDIVRHYFNIDTFPALICSPLREDHKPSFGIFTFDGIHYRYRDFATKDRGNLWDLLMKYFRCDWQEMLKTLYEEIPFMSSTISSTTEKKYKPKLNSTILSTKVRDWKQYDIEYWKSHGISLEWLKYADVYPISHIIITKKGKSIAYTADKYAYVYVENKEYNLTMKIYQPYNTRGFKWINKHDRSVVSLWTKIPEKGNRLCICASTKDALCLWANTGIPAIAIQGEGYGISDTAIKVLKSRYKHIYIMLDNDKAGLENAVRLSEQTGFTNIVLPVINGAKDISDLYKSLQDTKQFNNIIIPLFNDKERTICKD